MDSDEEVGLEIDLGQTSTNVSSEDSQSQQSLQTESTTESHDLKESEVFPQESVKTEPDVREKPRDDEESDNESLGVHHSHRKAQPLTCSDDDEDGLDRKFESVSKIPRFKNLPYKKCLTNLCCFVGYGRRLPVKPPPQPPKSKQATNWSVQRRGSDVREARKPAIKTKSLTMKQSELLVETQPLRPLTRRQAAASASSKVEVNTAHFAALAKTKANRDATLAPKRSRSEILAGASAPYGVIVPQPESVVAGTLEREDTLLIDSLPLHGAHGRGRRAKHVTSELSSREIHAISSVKTQLQENLKKMKETAMSSDVTALVSAPEVASGEGIHPRAKARRVCHAIRPIKAESNAHVTGEAVQSKAQNYPPATVVITPTVPQIPETTQTQFSTGSSHPAAGKTVETDSIQELSQPSGYFLEPPKIIPLEKDAEATLEPAVAKEGEATRKCGPKTQKEHVFVEPQSQQPISAEHVYRAPPHIRDPKEWEMFEDPSEFEPTATGNVTYNLWQLGNHRVVIRCGYHGYYKRGSTEESTLVHFQPKLEYQLFYGYEQLTAAEVSKAWINLAIRSAKCRLHRVHVSARNCNLSAVVKYTEQDLAEVLQSAQGVFNPNASLHVLSGVFDKLTSLVPGQYLLSHAPGNAQAHIKKTARSNAGCYDLKMAYTNIRVDSEALPWVPVDPNVLLPVHEQHGRIPCTFEPKDSGYFVKPVFKGKKKKKGKRKPKND